jgi:glyceraldehyde 3-phosphate dehydrogenase
MISNASCTTNCIAPALKAITDAFDIDYVAGVTVHAYTASQKLQDAPSKDLRDGRAAAQNMVPSSTGAANAVVKVIPSLAGKISLTSLRVPVIAGSHVFVTIKVADSSPEVTLITVKTALRTFTQAHPTIMSLSSDPLVSSDIIAQTHSVVVDEELTKVTGNNIELGLWYDNEWGYTCRLVDLLMISLKKSI